MTTKEKYGKMILKNNMRVSLNTNFVFKSYARKRCIGVIRVDINGEKGPNRYGHDVFFFAYDENGIQANPGDYCLGTNTGQRDTLIQSCSKYALNGSGLGCSLWIMHHGNMDYKYRDVSSEW